MDKIALEDLLKETDNLYETVVAMSKRARQVNDEQKKIIDKERENLPVPETRESEDLDDVEIDREALAREYTKYPKPTFVAMNEMKEKQILWDFPEEV
ncbi:MAG TPA: DNA-directed RNA polymerase subunit omega [bacterium]|nr:DNA-directed RNA polymerase subunit omega [bacterium]